MTTLVIGLGKTGQACLNYFHNNVDTLIAYDTRDTLSNLKDLQQLYPGVKFYCGEDWPEATEIEQAILSPGVPTQHPFVRKLVASNVSVVSDIAVFAKYADAPILAITGTNGKTTTTRLVTHLLRACGFNAIEGGNIGLPVLDLLALPVPDYYVLELSSFQLESTPKLNAMGAALLNLTSDHLDRHHNMQNYLAAKMKIFNGALWGVIPQGFKQPSINQVFELGPVGLDCSAWSPCLRLAHNQENVATALALLAPLGLPSELLAEGLRTFQGLPHRCEFVMTKQGITWVNDSKATNVASAIAAIESFTGNDKPIVLLAGGQGKGQDFGLLAKVIQEKIQHAVLFGADAKTISQYLDTDQYTHVGDLAAAVQWIKNHYQAQSVTALLSPACASLDQFSNYEERGEQFRLLVKG